MSFNSLSHAFRLELKRTLRNLSHPTSAMLQLCLELELHVHASAVHVGSGLLKWTGRGQECGNLIDRSLGSVRRSEKQAVTGILCPFNEGINMSSGGRCLLLACRPPCFFQLFAARNAHVAAVKKITHWGSVNCSQLCKLV